MVWINNSKVLIGSGSTSTSDWYFTGDFTNIALSWTSSASLGPSRFTVQVSNQDGLRDSGMPATTDNTGASTLTGVNIIGRATDQFSLLTNDERFRWMRVTVAPAAHSDASVTTIQLNGWGY